MGMLKRLRHKSNDSGAAMLVVTCVMAVISILCLSIILAGYQMYATVNDEVADEKYYQQALSFSKVLEGRLTGDRDDIESGSVEEFIYAFMQDDDSYPYTDEDGVTLKVTSSSTTDNSYGTLNINLIKEELSPGSNNMWADSKKSFLYIKTDVIAGNDIKATVTAKYEYEYAVENYKYYYYPAEDSEKVYCKNNDSDSSYIDIIGTDDSLVDSVLIRNLISNEGKWTINGTVYDIKRETLSGDKGYELSFIGYY